MRSPQPHGQARIAHLNGQKSVDCVVNWREPVTVGGSSQTEVTYTYKIVNLAPWTQRSDIQQAFSDNRAVVGGASKTNQAAGLKLTNNGWEVPGS